MPLTYLIAVLIGMPHKYRQILYYSINGLQLEYLFVYFDRRLDDCNASSSRVDVISAGRSRLGKKSASTNQSFLPREQAIMSRPFFYTT